MHVNQNISLKVSIEYYRFTTLPRAVWELFMHNFNNINTNFIIQQIIEHLFACNIHVKHENVHAEWKNTALNL